MVTQNIVRAATWLLFTLAGTAGIFFLLGADFVGATQLLVYVGGTLVLVVFGVMLTAQGPFINMRIGAGEWAIAAVVGLSLFSVLAICLWNVQCLPRPCCRPRSASRQDCAAQAAAEGKRTSAPSKDSTSERRSSRISARRSTSTPSKHLAATLLETDEPPPTASTGCPGMRERTEWPICCRLKSSPFTCSWC